MKNSFEQKLSQEYQKCWQAEKPTWTYNIIPAIPVVGDKLNDMDIRVLSYASSENISKRYACELEALNENEQLHRGRSEEFDEKYPLFRYSHITPFNRGDQFIITWFLLSLEYKIFINSFSNTAMDFAEQIAVSNTVKFTVERNSKQPNIDPNEKKCFEDSVPYLINDFKIIEPDVVIIPRTRFNKVAKYCGWNKLKRKAKLDKKIQFLKIQQAVPQRINIDKREPVDIDISKIDSWVKETRSSTTIVRHLQWLKENYETEKEKWTEII